MSNNNLIIKLFHLFNRKLKLRNTHYENPHGLMNYLNYSSAYDIG